MRLHYLAPALLLALSACTSALAPLTVTVLDGSKILTFQTSQRTPREMLIESGVILGPGDRALANGAPADLDQPIEGIRTVIQVRRAVDLTVLTPDGQQSIRTAALTVGEALLEAGFTLHAGDRLAPPADTLLAGQLTVEYAPSREITITSGSGVMRVRTAAQTVGEALAASGLPLLGLNYSVPNEHEPIPADGQVRIVQVFETVQLQQKPLPFDSEFVASAEVELDQQQVLQPGLLGLAVSRVRIRYEDGQEIARQTESEVLVRPAQNRILGYGTKIVTRTAVVDGATIEYWRAVQMFATSYSPCRSAADRCYPGTSSGLPVKKGVVAVVHRWYVVMQGQPIYVPGYGHATIEDVGGGIPGRYWIDLGYSDSDYQQWGEWVTVYFLTPVPPSIVYVLE